MKSSPSIRRISVLTLSFGLMLGVLSCASSGHEVVDRLDCNSCHASEYEAEPLHVDRGFARTCYTCHGLSDWSEADENHNRFGIDRGSHAGYDCQNCHLSTEDRTAITCIDCHAHSESRTNPYHIGNGEYEYKPAACLQCHGRGR